ncbi:MAG: hypothetical protein ACI9F2_000279 [Lysobacterales bacterium]|jgi:hypothetical protein
MNKSLTLLILLSFCLWIIPMGAYISLAQEANLCGGKRAICLCTKNTFKVKKKVKGLSFVKSATTTSAPVNDQRVTSLFGSDFLLFVFNQKQSLFLNTKVILPTISFFKEIEHVPKNTLFLLA